MDFQRQAKKNIPMPVNRLEGCHMEWEEPEVVELSKDPDAENGTRPGR